MINDPQRMSEISLRREMMSGGGRAMDFGGDEVS